MAKGERVASATLVEKGRVRALAKLAMAVLCVFALVRVPAHALQAGSALPDAALPRLDAPAASIALRALRGKVVYVDFWASWCAPCRESMPALDALFRREHERGFTVIGVNKDVSAGDAERFLRRTPVSFPLVTDANDALARALDVSAMPSGYLVDRRGVVRYVHRGFTEATGADIAAEVQALLRERP